MRCATCHNDNRTCPGHPDIELAAPCQAIYVDMVRKAAEMHLYQLLPLPHRRRQRPQAQGQLKRFNLAEKECLKNCPTCGAKTADKITWDKQAKMTMEWKSDGTNEAVTRAMFASDIDAIFTQIPDNSCYAMYLDPRQCRPESMMFKALPFHPSPSALRVRPGQDSAVTISRTS
jgi:DNA-directed RNA polymerase beta' subunit